MPPENRLDELTAREREVLDLVRLGLTNEEVAGRLGITEAGAKYHVSQILSKLGVSTREEAAGVALGGRRRWWAVLPLAAKAAGVAVMVTAVAGLGVLAWGVLRTDSPSPNLQNPTQDYVIQGIDLPPIPLDKVYELLDDGEVLMITVEANDRTVDPSGNPNTIEQWYEYRDSEGHAQRWRLDGLPVFVLIPPNDTDQLVLSEGQDSVGLTNDSVSDLLDRVRAYNLTAVQLINVADYRTHISRSDETPQQ